MTTETNFLQAIEADLRKNLKLDSYNRIAFHKILGISKSEDAKAVLVKELKKSQPIRESAVLVLTSFDDADLGESFLEVLDQNPTENEIILIMNFLQKSPNTQFCEVIQNIITKFIEEKPDSKAILPLYMALNSIGGDLNQIENFLLNIVESPTIDTNNKCFAIIALSVCQNISLYEDISKNSTDELTNAVFNSLYLINEKIFLNSLENLPQEDNPNEEDNLKEEDNLVIDIRVFLEKISPKFSTFSNETKTSFISCLITINHRETIPYIMETLTSDDQELIRMVLLSVLKNIEYMKDPDKLLRALISLKIDLPEDNELVVKIFYKFFSGIGKTKKFSVIRDKLYGYLVITLEDYFDTFRKDYIAGDSIEKNYPENFQTVRKFILNKLNPTINKQIVHNLINDDAEILKKTLTTIEKHLPHITNIEKSQLENLIEVLFDFDSSAKSNEIAASYIENINFEERYIRDKIIRIISIIGELQIKDAISLLVNIYNYLKKYPRIEIMQSVMDTLAMFNYPYILSEIKTPLFKGDELEKIQALELISVYSDQYSINVLFDLLSSEIESPSILVKAVTILTDRKMQNYSNAISIFKKIIDSTDDHNLKRVATTALGRCGLETEIDYLNQLYFTSPNEIKATIVKALANIINRITTFNKRTVENYLKNYLKDSNIWVRLFACLCLIKLGHSDAFKTICDMLIIKNQSVQRDIFLTLDNLDSVEFLYFLVSLLTPDYELSDDIINLISKAPKENISQIENFLITLFKRYYNLEPSKDNFTFSSKVIMKLLFYSKKSIADPEFTDMRYKAFMEPILQNNGKISIMNKNDIIIIFDDHTSAAQCGLKILSQIESFQKTYFIDNKMDFIIEIITENIETFKDEFLLLPDFLFNITNNSLFANKIVLDFPTANEIATDFILTKIPKYHTSNSTIFENYFELKKPINIQPIIESKIQQLTEDKETREKKKADFEAELKKLKQGLNAPSSEKVIRELENIGSRLFEQLSEIDNYVARQSIDKEVIRNIQKMTYNVYNVYKIELSRFIIE